MIMTWMKIIEFSELHGYLWKHVMIVAAVFADANRTVLAA